MYQLKILTILVKLLYYINRFNLFADLDGFGSKQVAAEW